MSEELVLWHDFNVALVTAAAGLLGLLFVALSIHIRTLSAARNAELRSVARTVFLGYVVSLTFGFLALMPQTLSAFGVELVFLNLAATLPFAAAARSGALGAQGLVAALGVHPGAAACRGEASGGRRPRAAAFRPGSPAIPSATVCRATPTGHGSGQSIGAGDFGKSARAEAAGG